MTNNFTVEHAISPDGKWLAYVDVGELTGSDILVIPLEGEDRTPRPYVQTRYTESQVALSPNGQWLAYVSDVSGRPEVYVRSFPEASGPIRISVAGGSEPTWALNGQEIFYRTETHMMAAGIEVEPVFRATKRDTLFADVYARVFNNQIQYDIDPRSGRFLLISGEEATQIVVVHNWFEELKAKVGNE